MFVVLWKLSQFVTTANGIAAAKRSVCVTAHEDMNPP